MKEKLIAISKKFVHHELIKGSFFIFLAGSINNFLSFIFNLFLTRKLSIETYGIYAAIIAFVTLLSIPAQAIGPVIIRFASEYIAKRELGKAKRFYKQSFLTLLFFGIVIIAIISFFSPFLNSFFRIHNFVYFFLSAVMVGGIYLTILVNGYLQSLLRFKFLSFLNIVAGVGKLIFGIGVVLMGFKIEGILGALIVSAFLPVILGMVSLAKLFGKEKETIVHAQFKKVYSYSLFAGLTMFSLTSFISSDIILVKHFFNPHQAGLYAGISLVGRIIFYFSSPIISVTLPVLMNRYYKGQKMKDVLVLSFILVFIPSILLSFAFAVFPAFFVKVFLGGGNFLQASQFVWLFGIFIAVYSVCNVFATFFLTIQFKLSSFIMGAGAILQIIGIIIFHQSFLEVILISTGIISVLCIVLMILLYKLTKARKTFNTHG